MSMILLEPAKHDLHNSLEDQAADHLINGVFGNYDPITTFYRVNLSKFRLFGHYWIASGLPVIQSDANSLLKMGGRFLCPRVSELDFR